MSRQTFKFADWTTTPDPKASATYSVFCRDSLNGADDDRNEDAEPCGWSFSVLDDKAEADKQQKAHVEDAGHRFFVEVSTCPTVVTPPPGSVLAGRLARLERATR
ncbi:hypothetical protein J7W19_21070 [Streptomyces mobaraensis NBRC 13819 = DSM 40847]|uniref:DUF7848 domain-containing protein n=1 Tax=Streptomyces mobaraensis (strain ATCC 29032 / DSM 40847 / JCM 4168 / NBRC 13819 / NCIMB 11159 / IPCR 16-22) TaxID=1223523 RepID=M3C217_STRM1|nr:hypothetical protein [Streptomyces mobaraensis]EME98050.1 hypothetical protein H340_23378 [Streptomyces mobaraensis NBRC 13819 = DSM 40847]QTT75539.1 hypothetical protein J7W19_21070 [Streptomyces mobaraensis NBRC 13819 = DSM 40847]